MQGLNSSHHPDSPEVTGRHALDTSSARIGLLKRCRLPPPLYLENQQVVRACRHTPATAGAFARRDHW